MTAGLPGREPDTPGVGLVIVRHADTDWTVSGQHTGRTDLPLNAAGRTKALALHATLSAWSFAAVWTSPLVRAAETARLAGFEASELPALMEWNYGDYDGLTSEQIRERQPDWDLWRDGCPHGERAADVGRRADAVLAALPSSGIVLVFSHGHMLRVLTARWLSLDASDGALFPLSPGGIGVLGNDQGRRVLRSWL